MPSTTTCSAPVVALRGAVAPKPCASIVSGLRGMYWSMKHAPASFWKAR